MADAVGGDVHIGKILLREQNEGSKSLVVESKDGSRSSVGLILPGVYHFRAQPAQEITVMSGMLRVDDAVYYPGGRKCTIEEGREPVIRVEHKPVAYYCDGD